MAVGTVGEVRNAAKAGQWGDLAPLTPDPSPPFRGRGEDELPVASWDSVFFFADARETLR